MTLLFIFLMAAPSPTKANRQTDHFPRWRVAASHDGRDEIPREQVKNGTFSFRFSSQLPHCHALPRLDLSTKREGTTARKSATVPRAEESVSRHVRWKNNFDGFFSADIFLVRR
jgi:hypothetical protein